MAKIIALNGSPRRNGTTVKLLNRALEGARKAGAETELIHLYTLKFTGCLSCFYCKRKDVEHGHCALRDDFFNITANTQALLERFLFSNMLYSQKDFVTLGKKMRAGIIYSMGMSQRRFNDSHFGDKMNLMEHSLATITGNPLQKLYSYDGIQFQDYSKYEADRLPEAERREYLAHQFPKDLEQAETMGYQLIHG